MVRSEPELLSQSRSIAAACAPLLQPDLDSLIQRHSVWLDSHHTDGTRLNLSGCSLHGLSLCNARCKNAIFSDCDLSGCDLTSSTFDDAILIRCNFRDARLTGCTLRCTDLSETDLSSAVGIAAPQLARSILTSANLPDSVAAFANLDFVDRLSDSSQKLLAGMNLVAAYCWLTVATTHDVAAFTTGNTTELPIIKADVPLVLVYALIPIFLLFNYIYINIYLQRLWESLSGLPAIFPDGMPLRQKINPWILNGFVSEHLSIATGSPRPLSTTQRMISSLMAWWLIPFTIALLFARYLREQDFLVSTCQACCLAASIFAAYYLHRLARNTLMYATADFSTRSNVNASDRKTAFLLSITTFVWSLLAVASFRDLPLISGITVLNLNGSNLSTTSNNALTGMQPQLHQGAQLSRLSLRGLKGSAAFLSDTVLDGSDLTNANLSHSMLDHIHGVDTLFIAANLVGASLENADLWKADLDNADLKEANLRNANITSATLRHADLASMDLSKMRIEANLSYANLFGAKLVASKLAYCQLNHANLDHTSLKGADLSYSIARESSFTDVDLTDADLTEADLRAAKLQWSDFRNTNLTRTELQGANMTDARNLTIDQVATAYIDKDTVCPANLKAQCFDLASRMGR